MPAWTEMTDLSTGDLVTEAHMDALRGNIEYLHDPNQDWILYENANIMTTSTTFVDVDATNVKIDITTTGGPLLITATVQAYCTGYLHFDYDIDGTRLSGIANGIAGADINTSGREIITIVGLAELSAGSHTIKLQWKAGSTGQLLAVSSGNSPITMMAIEL